MLKDNLHGGGLECTANSAELFRTVLLSMDLGFLNIGHSQLIQLENGRSTPGCLTVQSAIRPSVLRRLFAYW